jgi:hypothetical protein
MQKGVGLSFGWLSTLVDNHFKRFHFGYVDLILLHLVLRIQYMRLSLTLLSDILVALSCVPACR